MARVTFIEKTGCAGNARQKRLLTSSGHELEVRDLRDIAWTHSRLLKFLGSLPVAQWFNRAAPAIKQGEIVPESLDRTAALALLCRDPLLIRRPLLQVGQERQAGFDAAAINAWIGLSELPEDDLERCGCASVEPAMHYVQSAGGAIPCRFNVYPADAGRCKSG